MKVGDASSSSMPLPPVLVSHPHVKIDPSVLDGSPVVAGTKIPVRRLWAWHRRGTTIETLLKRYPQLGPARVLDALAFAYDNQELMQLDLAREQNLLDEEANRPPSGQRQTKLPF